MKNSTHIVPPFCGDFLLLPRFQTRAVVLIPVLLLSLLVGSSTTFAGSATWKAAPATGDWNTATNWMPPTVPNSSGDTATFATSKITGVSLSGTTQASGVVFNPGASAFTITTNSFAFTLGGVGITNSSTTPQNFVAGVDGAGGHGTFTFANSATAGNGTVFTVAAATLTGAAGGLVQFQNSSSAGHGTFTNNGSAVSQSVGGITVFYNTSTAANSILTCNGATVGGGGGGVLLFLDSSTAASATLTANDGAGGDGGGSIQFIQGAGGGTARIKVFGNGELEVSQSNPPGLTTGSIEGTGDVFLGANNLTVGGNNLSTTFSGIMQDGGHGGGTAGSLTKTGTGTLTLVGANTYTGTTTINAGTLLVKNRRDSGTGTGDVKVNAGTLGGTGTIAGSVTVGTGSGGGAFLSPGVKPTTPATFTIQGPLTFNADSTYAVNLNINRITADTVVANGVTIASNAQFSFIAGGNGTLPLGTVFTLISNTAATPIAGVFGNLPNGSTITAGSNRLQVSYQGGDGNNLTLTVVP